MLAPLVFPAPIAKNNSIVKKALAVAALAILSFSAQCSFADAGGCDVSKAGANDLLAASGPGYDVNPNTPGVKCSLEEPQLASDYCNEKIKVVRDEMLGRERRLIATRSSRSNETPSDQIFVFACVDGRALRVLDSDSVIFGGEITIEYADRDRMILVGPPPTANNTNYSARNAFVWSAKEQKYLHEEPADAETSSTTVKALACSKLKSATGNDLIILANRDYAGQGGGFFPFTHGEGCYTYQIPNPPEDCVFRVTLGEDRMISANRREIDFVSNHETGAGAFGYPIFSGV